MKKLLLSFVAAALSATAIDLPLLERFDAAADTQGSLLNGAAIEENAGLEKDALKLTGDATANRIIYTANLPITGGSSYALALNYKTEKLQNYTYRIDVIYQGTKCKNESFNLIASDERWSHQIFNFAAQEGVTSATIRMRLVKAPAGSSLLIDNFRVEKIEAGTADRIHLTAFNTDFSEWSLDKNPLLDHFMPGPGGSIIKDAASAKSGESAFKAVGNGKPMQYPLYISNISVEANGSYAFNGFYKAADAFKSKSTGILIFFYKDSNGKAIGQSRFPLRATAGEWKPIQHTFTAPANCSLIDIGLNIRNAQPADFVLLDQLEFKRQ